MYNTNLDISCSIVIYKGDLTIKKAIESFLHSSLNVQLYLVDNSPTDTLRSQFADLITDQRVHYIFNKKNLGYGAAHNVAIRQSINISKYHLVLNPDVSFQPGTLEELFAFLEKRKEIGLLIPKVFYPNGELQYVCKLLPTPADLILRRFLPASLVRKRMEKFELHLSGYNKIFEVPYIHGCFMFLRTEALKKTGLFDERFFMYPEDIDLTRRIHRHYKTIFYPYVQITHEHARESYKSLKLFWIHITNMIKYFNKWGWIFDKERKQVNKKILEQF